MAKSSTQFTCVECGHISNRWVGKCPECGQWNTLQEETIEASPQKISKGKVLNYASLSDPATNIKNRIGVGIGELDRTLGGGLVEGSAILIGGDPGIGKSTLLLQMVANIARDGGKCVYISGEESINQIKLRAERLGIKGVDVELAATTSVKDILPSLDKLPKGSVVIIDSIQTLYIDTINSSPGTVSQVKASAFELIRLAKRKGIAIFFVGHVTKDGQIAGPRVLEHMVDTVLYFEGERGYSFRILRAVKNRFGGTDEIGIFDMTGEGLKEVKNPSSLFLTPHTESLSGNAIFAGMEGTRPILVEVQALVSATTQANPRRAVVGWDNNRLAMLLAVLETRGGIKLSDKEVYLNIAGGFKVQEPAADLAVASALISAVSNLPTPAKTIFFGEIGLSGEVRQVNRMDTRLKESAKLGFSSAIIPECKKHGDIKTRHVKHIRELVECFSG